MIITLFLDLKKVTHWYGGRPDAAPVDSDNTRTFCSEPDFDDDTYWPLLDKYFVNQVDILCDAIIDYCDPDYLNAEQCRKLSQWLDGQIADPPDTRLPPLYRKIKEYADAAVRLGTGIIVEC